MIKATLHHIAIIVSSEEGVDFYKAIGFKEISREQRPNDQLIWLEGHGCRLEVFIKPNQPQRITDPEANGLRHIAFEVENLEEVRKELEKYNPGPINDQHRIFFVKDPDGQPIEFKESR